MLEGMYAAPVLNPLEIIHGSPKQTRILPSRIRSVFRIDTPSKILTPYSGKTKIFLIENITQALKRFGAIKFMTPVHHELKKKKKTINQT